MKLTKTSGHLGLIASVFVRLSDYFLHKFTTTLGHP
jgi:hypothetical protein